jgi:hypothetical protein
VWAARLRWRFRGALLWPLFGVLTVADALLLTVLPISGRHTRLVPALLLTLLLNLLAVAGPSRLGALWLRRRRPELPRLVAEDRSGTALVCLVSVALVIMGAVHAPSRAHADRAVAAQRDAVRAFVLAHGLPAYRAHLGALDTEQESSDYFRSCVPGDPAAGLPDLCLLVDTTADPPQVRIDADHTPNRHS